MHAMKNKFMITITDLNGSRNFLLSQIIKKIALYLVLFVFTIFVTGALYIKYLGSKIDNLSQTKAELNALNQRLRENIEASQIEFEAIEGKIADLEHEFGLDPEADERMIDRLSHIKPTSEEEIKNRADKIVNQTFSDALVKEIFMQIPNGRVMQTHQLSEKFGWRNHPVLKRKQFHPGVDLRTPLKTPIYAPADGIIQYSGAGGSGYGNLVEIRHNYGFTTRYAHLDSNLTRKVGEFVSKGDLIAFSGNTGLSTGPHLHYEIRFLQLPLNPLNFIEWNKKNYKEIFTKEEDIPWQSLIKAMQTPLKQR